MFDPIKVIELDDYQDETATTAIYPGKGTFLGVNYCTLKLNGEAGEVAEKVGKIIRDEESVISPERREQIALELGDVLWYIARLADELDYQLSDIANMNLRKLYDRK